MASAEMSQPGRAARAFGRWRHLTHCALVVRCHRASRVRRPHRSSARLHNLTCLLDRWKKISRITCAFSRYHLVSW